MELVQDGRLSGSFAGWNADAIFEFTNGKKWSQAKYKYKYKYKYRPEAKIWKDGSRHFIEVDGMDEMVEVKRA